MLLLQTKSQLASNNLVEARHAQNPLVMTQDSKRQFLLRLLGSRAWLSARLLGWLGWPRPLCPCPPLPLASRHLLLRGCACAWLYSSISQCACICGMAASASERGLAKRSPAGKHISGLWHRTISFVTVVPVGCSITAPACHFVPM